MISFGIHQPIGFPALPADWVAESESFLASDEKTRLCSLVLKKAKGNSARVLLVLHGLGEHGGRYLHLPFYLKSVVDAIYCLDHRGHGRSSGIRGHVDQFDDLVEDAWIALTRIQAQLQKQHPNAEFHLLAHSLGAHVALRLLFLKPEIKLNSMTLTAPFLGIKAHVPWIKKTLARFLSRVWGSLQLDTALDTSVLSHDLAVKEAYLKDPLVHSKMSPRFFSELHVAFQDTLNRNTGISVPLLMIVPLQDRLVEAEKSLQFFQALKHPHKRLVTYPEFFHESLNEIGKEIVFEEIRGWISKFHTVADHLNSQEVKA